MCQFRRGKLGEFALGTEEPYHHATFQHSSSFKQFFILMSQYVQLVRIYGSELCLEIAAYR